MKTTQILLIAILVSCMVISYTQASSPGWLINRRYKEESDYADELADALVDVILSDKVAHEVKPNNAGKYNPDEIFYKKRTRALADRLIEHIYTTFDEPTPTHPSKRFIREMADKIAYEIKANNAGKYNPDRPVK